MINWQGWNKLSGFNKRVGLCMCLPSRLTWAHHTAGISWVPLPSNSGLSLTCFRLRESTIQYNENTILLFSERLAHLSREWDNVEFPSCAKRCAGQSLWFEAKADEKWLWRIPLGRYSALQRNLGQAGCSCKQEGMGNYARHERLWSRGRNGEMREETEHCAGWWGLKRELALTENHRGIKTSPTCVWHSWNWEGGFFNSKPPLHHSMSCAGLWDSLERELDFSVLGFDCDCSILSLYENWRNQSVLDPFPAVWRQTGNVHFEGEMLWQ